MDRHISILACLGLSLVVAACGGNSGAGTNAADTVAVQGAWSGSNSLGNSYDMLLLENGALYQVFGTSLAGAFTALGMNQGSYSVSGNTFAASITQYNPNGTSATGSLAASVVANTTINGMAAASGSNAQVGFSSIPTAVAHPGYNYNTPAQLSDIAGAWPAGFVLGQASPFVFAVDPSSGALSSSNAGCAISGAFTPRSTNVFSVSLTLGPAPCTSPAQTYTGVAISYLASNGKRQLTAALQTPDKSGGTALYAQR